MSRFAAVVRARVAFGFAGAFSVAVVSSAFGLVEAVLDAVLRRLAAGFLAAGVTSAAVSALTVSGLAVTGFRVRDAFLATGLAPVSVFAEDEAADVGAFLARLAGFLAAVVVAFAGAAFLARGERVFVGALSPSEALLLTDVFALSLAFNKAAVDFDGLDAFVGSF